jgi:PAS domain S-box-containing protein
MVVLVDRSGSSSSTSTACKEGPMELLKDLLSSDGFMPHGHCYLWRPGLVWLHFVADALTALAYTSIPFTLLYFVRKRRDVPFHWMFLCFGVFIIACGATHAMEIWTLWHPTYWLAGIVKAITAIASVPTAILLIKLVPHALAIPTPTQLTRAHDELRRAHEALELRVQERTAELTRKNAELAAEIAERKRATETVRRLEEQHEADAKILALLEAAPDAMVVTDKRGRIVLINAQTEQLFGYARADLLGKSVDILVPDRFHDAHAQHRASYSRDPTSRRAMGAGRQLLGLRSDATEFPADISLSKLQTTDGLLVFTTIRDVTHRKQAEEALRRAKDAAEAANTELEAFSYSVAHDLRSPLRGMAGYSTALLEDHGALLPDEAKDYLTRVVESSLRMSEIIDALLALARLTRTEPRREDVDLTQLAHIIIQQLRTDEPHRTVDFIAADDLIVHGDPELLRLLLDNLLSNAWKFTSKQPAARVELGRHDVNGTPVYYIRDNGAGFDVSLVDDLFVPFRRLHSPSEFDGIGIGLATVQRIVHTHGGRIWAEGARSKGATFRFTLPAPPPTPLPLIDHPPALDTPAPSR